MPDRMLEERLTLEPPYAELSSELSDALEPDFENIKHFQNEK